MFRLGGNVLSSADPKTTSAAKGETIADTIRVLENYADAIVIRHPCEGSVRVAADYADVPIINAGDGGHEHPTQTLCDLYTLQREKGTLKNLNVLLWGDLKNGRTVHSLVYGLARFGARIIPLPAEGFGLPEHVTRRLLRDYDCVPLSREGLAAEKSDEFPVDVRVRHPRKAAPAFAFFGRAGKGSRSAPGPAAAQRPLQNRCLLRDAPAKGTNVWRGHIRGVSRCQRAFLKDRRFKQSSVMHPLPRVNELGYDLDDDARAVYFKQASYGVPVRMALSPRSCKSSPASSARPRRRRSTRCTPGRPSRATTRNA